jgi:hypothetical protein
MTTLSAPTFKPFDEVPSQDRSDDKVRFPVIVSPQETLARVVVVVVDVVVVVVVDEVVVVVTTGLLQVIPDHPESHTHEPPMHSP